jgi:hypothetical protein
MRAKIRWFGFTAALGGLLLMAVPSSADHATRTDVKNLVPLGESANTDTLANSDLAFWGNMAFQGHWEGFRILDITNPGNPTVIVDYDQCGDPTLGLGGGQGDVIVWGNLLVRAWNSDSTATGVCGGPVPVGFEGAVGAGGGHGPRTTSRV